MPRLSTNGNELDGWAIRNREYCSERRSKRIASVGRIIWSYAPDFPSGYSSALDDIRCDSHREREYGLRVMPEVKADWRIARYPVLAHKSEGASLDCVILAILYR